MEEKQQHKPGNAVASPGLGSGVFHSLHAPGIRLPLCASGRPSGLSETQVPPFLARSITLPSTDLLLQLNQKGGTLTSQEVHSS